MLLPGHFTVRLTVFVDCCFDLWSGLIIFRSIRSIITTLIISFVNENQVSPLGSDETSTSGIRVLWGSDDVPASFHRRSKQFLCFYFEKVTRHLLWLIWWQSEVVRQGAWPVHMLPAAVIVAVLALASACPCVWTNQLSPGGGAGPRWRGRRLWGRHLRQIRLYTDRIRYHRPERCSPHHHTWLQGVLWASDDTTTPSHTERERERERERESDYWLLTSNTDMMTLLCLIYYIICSLFYCSLKVKNKIWAKMHKMSKMVACWTQTGENFITQKPLSVTDHWILMNSHVCLYGK